MELVAGVDAFGGVAAEEVLVELQAAEFFEDGDAVFFGAAGINGAFVNDHSPGFHGFADGFAGFDQRGEVGALVVVHGGGDGDDVKICRANG